MDSKSIRPHSSQAIRTEALNALFERELVFSLHLAKRAESGEGATGEELAEISTQYNRLLKQAMRVTSVSDSTQLELVRTGRELSEAIDRTQQLGNEKDELLALAAHDLRTPLAGICGLARLIESSGGPDSDMATDIVLSSERLLQVISDLLDLDRFETCTIKPENEAHPLLEVARSIELRFRDEAAAKQIRLRMFTPQKETTLVFDLQLFLRVSENLISNALKFSPKGGEVLTEIQVLEDSKTLLFSVKDHGPGISAIDQAKLYKKFTRLSARPTNGEPSTGLGLALTRAIIEMMGGSIQCESRLGAGATFTVKVPVSMGLP